MTNNLLEHVQEMTNDFERVITDHKSWHTNLGVPNWDVIKSHLLQSQLKTIELVKEELEGMRTIRLGEIKKANDWIMGARIGGDDGEITAARESLERECGGAFSLSQTITLLDTIIQDIKLQMK